MTRRERLERKVEKRNEWAEKASARSNARFNAAHRIADGIPLGQPILLDHHSAGRARSDQARMHSNMSKSVSESKLADHHEQKAAGLSAQLDSSVFSDDPNAIEALEARIAEREASVNAKLAINKAWRKTAGTTPERVAQLLAVGAVSEKLAESIGNTMRVCHYLDKPFSTTNERALIRKDRERIVEVKRRQALAERATAAGGILITPMEGGWCRVVFEEKPERSILNDLRGAGFRWGSGAWIGDTDKLPESVRAMQADATQAPPLDTQQTTSPDGE